MCTKHSEYLYEFFYRAFKMRNKFKQLVNQITQINDLHNRAFVSSIRKPFTYIKIPARVSRVSIVLFY